MYKFIYEGKVIDIVENIRYLRYLKKSKHVVGSDSSSANCVQASNGIDIYGIQGAKLPEYLNYKKVIIRQIDVEEYKKLQQLLNNSITITADNVELQQAKSLKVQELEENCKKIITDGIIVTLSDGQPHTFELTVEDQLNLAVIHNKILQGTLSCVYHEKGKVCRRYDSDDLLTVINAANKHVEYNTTYFNLMKNCIYNMYNIEKIKGIHYGDELPNAAYQVILSQI